MQPLCESSKRACIRTDQICTRGANRVRLSVERKAAHHHAFDAQRIKYDLASRRAQYAGQDREYGRQGGHANNGFADTHGNWRGDALGKQQARAIVLRFAHIAQ